MRALQVAMAVVVLTCAGCLWRGYGRVMEIHVEVLDSMAKKLCDLAQAGKRPVAEDMAEFVYPAQRARQFCRYFDENEHRASYARFEQLLSLYESEVQMVDRSRVDATTWKEQGAEVCKATSGVLAMAEEVRQALRRESRS